MCGYRSRCASPCPVALHDRSCTKFKLALGIPWCYRVLACRVLLLLYCCRSASEWHLLCRLVNCCVFSHDCDRWERLEFPRCFCLILSLSYFARVHGKACLKKAREEDHDDLMCQPDKQQAAINAFACCWLLPFVCKRESPSAVSRLPNFEELDCSCCCGCGLRINSAVEQP